MKVFRALVCFIFLAGLQDAGYSGFVNAETPIYTEMEGGSITVKCTFSLTGRRRLFCTGKCEEGNILIDTTDDSAQNGRYSIKYKEGFYPLHKTVLNVSITQLRRSDSGMYRCSLDRILPFDSNEEFEIVVTDASVTSKPKSTVQPSPVSTFLSSAPMTTATVTTSPKTPNITEFKFHFRRHHTFTSLLFNLQTDTDTSSKFSYCRYAACGGSYSDHCLTSGFADFLQEEEGQ
ncbi:uncharacterized protein LOC102305995 [Haplochromis burtoni]|uniref:uncharacterized protein LOC102305995 n=1 Tax=Haplochromis burtoni TaxID=8153 RepID=UPI001C2DABF4|nr:uncharacterized protein LOC102305995 [Haplochromis burtoni]